MRVFGVCLLVLAFPGCAEDQCISEPPAFQVDLVMSVAGSVARINSLEVKIQHGDRVKSQILDPQPLKARGRTALAVFVGNPGAAGFNVLVEAKALDENGQTLAAASQSFQGTGDSCNFFELSLKSGDLPDGGPLPTDTKKGDGPAVIRDTTTALDSAGSCHSEDCTVRLSGQISGLFDLADKRVIIEGNITVTPHNGADDVSSCDLNETGCLKVIADEIILQAGVTINASGQGHGGGGGGGGGPGFPGGICNTGCNSCSAGAAGVGQGSGGSGQPGVSFTEGSKGGAGGKGGGPGAGGGGPEVTSFMQDGQKNGIAGGPGGYNVAGDNTDTSTDESVLVGSGGGGGSGGASASEWLYSSVGGSGGGGAGNPGGGKIELQAQASISIAGELRADGQAASRGTGNNGTDGSANNLPCDVGGNGGNGGNATTSGASAGGQGMSGYFLSTETNSCNNRFCGTAGSQSIRGGDGGPGGAGSGGGILLKAPSIEITGKIQTLGGGSAQKTGGSVKIFHRGAAPSTAGVSAGRILIQPY